MRSAAIGLGALFITLFMFVSMSTLIENTIFYQEANAICDEAIYQTEVFMDEELDVVYNDATFEKVFITFLKPLIEKDEITMPNGTTKTVNRYDVHIYTIDYETGLIDIGISRSWRPWANRHITAPKNPRFGKDETYEARRTMIIDIPQK